MRRKSIRKDRTEYGTYTAQITFPMVIAALNLSTFSASTRGYVRVGNIVQVFGSVIVNPISTATLTRGLFSLPFATTFTANNELAGVAFCPDVAGMGAAMRANLANNCAEINFISTDINSQTMNFIFTYRII